MRPLTKGEVRMKEPVAWKLAKQTGPCLDVLTVMANVIISFTSLFCEHLLPVTDVLDETSYRFDYVFGPQNTTLEIYKKLGHDCITESFMSNHICKILFNVLHPRVIVACR